MMLSANPDDGIQEQPHVKVHDDGAAWWTQGPAQGRAHRGCPPAASSSSGRRIGSDCAGHGSEHIQVAGHPSHRFRDEAIAERLCATYYSDAAAAWVREHHAREIAYSVLGSSPPNDVCIKRRD